MKKLLLTIATAVCLGGAALAQTSAITDAYMYRKDGNLTAARTEIDKAVKHEKTSTSAKAWYFRGLIYEGLATDPAAKRGGSLNSIVSALAAKDPHRALEWAKGQPNPSQLIAGADERHVCAGI